jgi:hypothetical protein
MYCQNCGKQLPDGSRYCNECGTPVAPPAFRSPQGPQANPAGQTPVMGIPVPEEATSPKSRLIATLLAFFVGRLGVHRFYIGKIGSGVALLLLTIFGTIISAVAGAYSLSNGFGFWWGPSLGTIGPLWTDIWGLATFGGFLLAASSIWGFVDFIIIVFGRMKDTQGRRIRDWKA